MWKASESIRVPYLHGNTNRAACQGRRAAPFISPLTGRSICAFCSAWRFTHNSGRSPETITSSWMMIRLAQKEAASILCVLTMKKVGRADYQTTMNIYTHLGRGHMEKATRQIYKMFHKKSCSKVARKSQNTKRFMQCAIKKPSETLTFEGFYGRGDRI